MIPYTWRSVVVVMVFCAVALLTTGDSNTHVACTQYAQGAPFAQLSATEQTHLRVFFDASDETLCTVSASVLKKARAVAELPRRTKKKVKTPPPLPLRDGSSGVPRDGLAPDLDWKKSRLENENGEIPAEAVQNAQRQIAQMRAVQGRAAAVGRGMWQSLGPGNIGGRVRSMLVHPTTPSIMYAGGVAGGVWKSVNGGASWSPLNDFLPNLSITTLAFDPADPNIIWAGTGDDVIGAGVYRSTDAGANWVQVPGTTTSDFSLIRRITAARIDGTTRVTVATGSGIFWTNTNGATWTKAVKTISVPSLANVFDVEHDPITPRNMVAATAYNGSAMWYSRDAGVTWTVATVSVAVAGRIELAYAPSNPMIVYASVEGVRDALKPAGALYKSTDGGATYTLVNEHKKLIQGWHNNSLWVDPTNPNRLMFGAVDVYRSEDGGVSIEKISDWASWPISAHADHHWFVTHPNFNGTTNRTVFLANDGGVYRMDDYRAVGTVSGWTELNNALGVTQFYGVDGNPDTGAIIGGTQDNGNLIYHSYLGVEEWLPIASGDGGFVEIDKFQPELAYIEYVKLKGLKQYNQYTGRGVFINGEYHVGEETLWKPSPYYIPDAKNEKASFIAPFALDPNVSHIMFAGGYSLWRTTTLTATVTTATGPAWYEVKAAGEDPLTAIGVAKGDSNTVWVGHRDGGVWKSTNATAAPASVTWSDMGTALPNRSVNEIWIDPTNAAHVMIGFGAFEPDNLWTTSNGGETWTTMTGTGLTALPSLPVYAISVHPDNPSWMYIGTQIGLFTTEDSGAHWSTLSEGPVNSPIYDMTWVGSSLVLATHGRGMFALEFSPPKITAVTLSGSSDRQVRYAVTFNKNVTAVDETDFVVQKTGSVNARILTVSGSGTTYEVTVDVLSGIGNVTIGLASVTDIVDLQGQNLVTTPPFVAPRCTAIARGVVCSSIVTTIANTGAGSLRQVIADAPAGATIIFDPTLSEQTIALTSALVLTKSLTIDATLTNAQITIDGGGTSGLFNAAATSVTLNGLHMVNGYGGQGGALWNAGTLLVRNSSITGSRSSISGAAIFNTGTATFVNTTIYDNTANSGYVITNENDATMSIVHTTISGNTAPSMVLYNVGVLSLKNSIIADSVAMQCYSSSFYGTISIVNTIIEDRSCKATLGGDPKLAVAALNGAKTYTKALNTGSNAINAANDSVCASALVGSRDQRGALRPAGARCDIGAYEANGVVPTATTVRVATATRTKTLTRTRTRTATPRPPARTATRTPTRRVP